jgi:biotin carboxylase
VQRAQSAYLGLGEGGVLVQQWVDGRSLGTEAIFVDGKLVDAFVMDDQFAGDYVSPVGHSLPPQIDRALHDQVVRACEAFGVALGLTTGAVNFDLRCMEQIMLIEVNPRLGGNSITDLVYEAYGSRVAHAAVSCALGRDPMPYLARSRNRPIAARLILTRGRGVVRFAAPPMAHAERPDVLAIDLTVGDGQRTTVHVDDFCLLGRCVATGPDAASAARTAEEVTRAIADTVRLDQGGE